MSLVWRFNISNKDSLWASIIHHKYNQQNQINNTKNVNKNSSLTWRSLKLGQSLCKLGLAHLIGEGNQTSFWEDKWCSTLPIKNYLHDPFPGNEKEKKVSDYLIQGRWDFSNLSFVLPKALMDNISNLHIPLSHRLDRLYWPHSKNGKFSTSYVASFIQKPHAMSLYTVDLTWLWKHLHITPRIIFFFHNRLPTKYFSLQSSYSHIPLVSFLFIRRVNPTYIERLFTCSLLDGLVLKLISPYLIPSFLKLLSENGSKLTPLKRPINTSTSLLFFLQLLGFVIISKSQYFLPYKQIYSQSVEKQRPNHCQI